MIALLAGLALGAPYGGSFAAPPVHHWSVRLPGEGLNSASHTEQTRPVFLDDDLLVGSAGGTALYRLTRDGGDLVTAYPAAASVESEAVVQGGRVYFADTSGTAWCYELDGDLVWSRDTGAPVLVRPTVTNDRVFLTNVDDLGVALDADTGELAWRYQRPPDPTRDAELRLYAAPAAVPVGELVLLGFSDGSVVALDQQGGDLQWERRVGEGIYPDIVAAPAIYGSDILASGYLQPLVAIDIGSHNVRWRLEHGAAAEPLVTEDGLILHPGTDGVLRAITALTGAVRWEWDSATSGALTTPILTDAGLVVGSSAGSVYLIDPDSGEETWRYRGSELLEGISASPAVDGRQLVFVSNSGILYSMLSPRGVAREQRGAGGAPWTLRRSIR